MISTLNTTLLLFPTYTEAKGALTCLKKSGNVQKKNKQLFYFRNKKQVIWLGICGIGKNRASQFFNDLLKDMQPQTVFLLGFSGSLSKNLKTGDCIVSKSLCSTTEEHPLFLQYSDSETLLKKIKQTYFLEQTLSSSNIIYKLEDKLNLKEKYQANSVEMEAYPLAQIAFKCQINFQQIRWILDTVDEPLLPTESFIDPLGKPYVGKLIKFLLFHPTQIKHLMKISLNSQKIQLKIEALIKALVGA